MVDNERRELVRRIRIVIYVVVGLLIFVLVMGWLTGTDYLDFEGASATSKYATHLSDDYSLQPLPKT